MKFKVSRGVRGFLLLAPVLCCAMLSAKVSAAELLYSMKVITYTGRYFQGENCATMVYKNDFSDMCRSTRDKVIGALRLTMLPQEPISIAFLVDPGENGGGIRELMPLAGRWRGIPELREVLLICITLSMKLFSPTGFRGSGPVLTVRLDGWLLALLVLRRFR